VLPADHCGPTWAVRSQPATVDTRDVTDRDELPPPPPTFGPDGERGWRKMLEYLREGTWRQITLARAMGVVPSAINEKKKRDPEWGRQFDEAKAEGEQRLLRKLDDAAATGKSWQAYAWILERIHGYMSPSDRAKIEHLRAIRPDGRAEPTEPDQVFL
jgi:hypothetical protein